jgi:hypothetical protein
MKNELIIVVILMQSMATAAFGQNNILSADSVNPDRFAVSALNLRPEVLVKNDLLIRLNLDFPEYKKILNTSTGNMEDLSDNVVLNEMLVNVYIDYGISPKLTLYTQVPVSDIHHYSPMGAVTGKGFADIGLGAGYMLLGGNSRNNTLTGEGTVFIPTGESSNSNPSSYPLGMGIVRLKGALTGMYRSGNSALIYSGYYEFRPMNSEDRNIGDEFGVTLIRQNYFKTRYGNFGIEYGGYSFFKTEDKNNGIKVSHSGDYEADAYAGGWFEYRKNLFIRLGLPYTIYQNGSPFTKSNVLFQLDYRFKL